jgi:hypothetical protein
LIAILFNLRNKDYMSFLGWHNPKIILENDIGIFSIFDISKASTYTLGFVLLYPGHDGLILYSVKDVGFN